MTMAAIGAAVAGSAVAAGGAAIAANQSKSETPRAVSRLSKNQKVLDAQLFDFLMGIKRDGAGKEVSRAPLMARLAQRKLPQYFAPPQTDRQKSVLTMADGVAGRLKGGLKRFDSGRLDQLVRGVMPGSAGFQDKPAWLATGGTIGPGQSAVVGEDGPEVITVNPDGTVTVTPNPASMADPQAAAEKSEDLQQQTGLPGYALGTTPKKSAWSWQQDDGSERTSYFDTNYNHSFQNNLADYWKFAGDASGSLKGGFDNWLTGQYEPLTQKADKNWYAQYDKKTQPDQYNTHYQEYKDAGKTLKNDWSWYTDLQKQYGGDISKTPLGWDPVKEKFKGSTTYSTDTMGNVVQGESTSRGNQIHQAYADQMAKYLATLPQVARNEQLDNLLGQLPAAERASFGTWLQANPQWGTALGITTNPYGLTGGQWGFQDPYSVDLANLTEAQRAYLTGKGYQYNEPTAGTEAGPDPNWQGEGPPESVPGTPGTPGGWAKPATPAVDPYDYTGLAAGLGGDDYDAFNQFLTTYGQGSLSGYGVNFDPTSGNWGFGSFYGGKWNPVPDSVAPGLQNALTAFQAAKTGGTPPTGPGGGTAGAGTNPGQTLADAMMPSLTALAGSQYNPSQTASQFDAAVATPAWNSFERHTIPSINENFAGGNLFGSAREKSVAQGQRDLNQHLTSMHADWQRSSEDNFESRKALALNQAMTLAKLPAEIANSQASGDAIKASIAATWSNLEIQKALTEAELSNSELSLLMMLNSIYGTEQQQLNAEWQAEFLNAVQGDGGLSWEKMLELYQWKLA